MEPRTLRAIGNAGIVAGVVGLTLSVILVGLVIAGTTDPPSTVMMVVIPIQSVVNVVVGWNLRRQAMVRVGDVSGSHAGPVVRRPFLLDHHPYTPGAQWPRHVE